MASNNANNAGDAPTGSTELNSSPPTRDPQDNPVLQTGLNAPDVLADEVRDGTWKTAQEQRDDQRGQ